MQHRLSYRPREFAAAAGLSAAFVYQEMASGRIPVVRIGRAARIPSWWIEEIFSKKQKPACGGQKGVTT